MTKEEIAKELVRLRKKVDICTNNIFNYNEKIKKLESDYDQSNLLISKYQSYLCYYYSSIQKKINGLDKDSNFSCFYTNNINKIFNGRENQSILDSVSLGKKDLIKQINSFEEKIHREDRRRVQYKQIICELETQLKSI